MKASKVGAAVHGDVASFESDDSERSAKASPSPTKFDPGRQPSESEVVTKAFQCPEWFGRAPKLKSGSCYEWVSVSMPLFLPTVTHHQHQSESALVSKVLHSPSVIGSAS